MRYNSIAKVRKLIRRSVLLLKFISWNVNGLRAIVNKNFLEVFHELDADFFCLQETKLQAGQIDLDLPGYYQYWNYAERKGYSGTAIFAKKPALNATYGMGIDIHDTEGRLITLEYSDFFLVTCYTPNSQSELKRLDYRLEWAALSRLLDNGFIDTFRYFYPTQEGVYSWWNYRFNSRKNNAGWRIDYFLTSKDLEPRLADAKIHTDIMGSDHCPVELDLK